MLGNLERNIKCAFSNNLNHLYFVHLNDIFITTHANRSTRHPKNKSIYRPQLKLVAVYIYQFTTWQFLMIIRRPLAVT